MIRIPAILREIASFGGSFIRKRTPSDCRATLFPPPRDAMSSWHVNELLVTNCDTIRLCTTSEKQSTIQIKYICLFQQHIALASKQFSCPSS